MQTFVLAALAFALVAVLFALQNLVPVQVTFLAWTFEGSLALVLFVALIVGAVISVLVSVPSMIKARWTASGLRKQIAALEAELDRHRRSEGSVTGHTSSPTPGSASPPPAPPARPPSDPTATAAATSSSSARRSPAG